jgi:hypothetical protein
MQRLWGHALVLVGSYLILGKIETRGDLESPHFSGLHLSISSMRFAARTFIIRQKR